jgi:hypothetical protein
VKALNIAGLFVSAVGSGLFIWHDGWERRRHFRKKADIEKAEWRVLEDEKELNEYKASISRTLDVTKAIPANAAEADREAAQAARAREEERFRGLAQRLETNLKESRASLNELKRPDPDRAEIESLPPLSHIVGATLLAIGFVLQLFAVIFEP